MGFAMGPCELIDLIGWGHATARLRGVFFGARTDHAPRPRRCFDAWWLPGILAEDQEGLYEYGNDALYGA